jgi:hypothetical protein
VRVDRRVALARGFPETVKVENLDFTPRVFDHSGLLQRMRDDGNAAAPHAQHLGEDCAGWEVDDADSVPGVVQDFLMLAVVAGMTSRIA